MFVFGHAGVTIGTAMIIDAITCRGQRPARAGLALDIGRCADPKNASANAPGKPALLPIRRWLDYRLLVVGSMLPDIIDKPLGQAILKDSISNGRIYAHSWLFILVTGIVGTWLFRSKGQGWLLTLAFGSLMHDLEDQMWGWPESWLWPAKGWGFPREDLTGWLPDMFHALATDPEVFIPELFGIGFLVYAAVKVFAGRRLVYALKTGRIE